MPFFPSLPDDAGPPSVFKRHPDIYGPWSHCSEALMNGPSPLDRGQRELILTYAAHVAGCRFVQIAHAEVAYALGMPRGLIDRLIEDFAGAPVDQAFKTLLAFAAKLTRAPGEVSQTDADAVFAAGWSEQALHDTIAISARAAFMHRLVQGHGFTPPSTEAAARHAERRAQYGYVNLYPQFREGRASS